eukprot:scaffold108273_cov40-Prasinocladus_malaysianus.AAC.1
MAVSSPVHNLACLSDLYKTSRLGKRICCEKKFEAASGFGNIAETNVYDFLLQEKCCCSIGDWICESCRGHCCHRAAGTCIFWPGQETGRLDGRSSGTARISSVYADELMMSS